MKTGRSSSSRPRGCRQFAQQLDGLVPERTRAPLVALAVEVDPSPFQLEVAGAQVGDLLHTRTRVVEEQQQGPVAGCQGAVRRHAGEHPLDLVALQIEGPWRWCPLHRQGGDPFRLLPQFGAHARNEVEQRLEPGQALVARPGSGCRVRPRVRRERQGDPLRREIVRLQPRQAAAAVPGDELQEESDRVAVARDRRGAQSLPRLEMVLEERMERESRA